MPIAAGLHFFAQEAGNTARPPVILIHGAGGTHLYWPPQVRRLQGQRIYALDLPGHGRSEGVGRQRVEDYSQAVVDFMRASRLRAAVLIGHSLGSAIALALAKEHPRRVLGLGLLGAGARLRVAPAILDAAGNPTTHRAAVDLITQRSYSVRASTRLKELASERMAETRPTVLHGDLLACDGFNVVGQLGEFTAPTLILAAADDQMTPLKLSEELREEIHDARLEIIPEAGHMLMLEQPARVADALGRFLNSIPYQSAGRKPG